MPYSLAITGKSSNLITFAQSLLDYGRPKLLDTKVEEVMIQTTVEIPEDVWLCPTRDNELSATCRPTHFCGGKRP